MRLRNELTQASIARECAKWIKEKVKFKGSKFPGVVGGKFIYNIRKNGLLINNTNDFSASGLGCTRSDQIIFANSINDNTMTSRMLKCLICFGQMERC